MMCLQIQYLDEGLTDGVGSGVIGVIEDGNGVGSAVTKDG